MESNTVWDWVLNIGTVIGFLLLLFFLCAHFDIFFAGSARENRAVFVMKGSRKGGQYVRTILVSKENSIKDNGEVGYDTGGSKPFTILGRPYLGLPFVHFLDEQKMVWEQFNEEDNKTDYRDEDTKYLFISQTNYAVTVRDAEDKENFPIDLVMGVIAYPVNAYTARFGVTDWQKQFRDLITQSVNNVVGEFTFNDLKSEIDDLAKTSFGQRVMDDLERLETGKKFSDLTGHEIVRIAIRKIDPDDSRKENREALSAKSLAKLKAEGVIEEAKGLAQAEVEKAKGSAEARGIKANAEANATVVEGNAKVEVAGKMYAVEAKDEKTVSVARSKAIENHKGTLAYGVNASVLLQEEKEAKP